MKEENDTEEVEFNWDDYLKTTNSEAAPKSCFRQSEIPPQNEFQKGQKLETVDPRNRTSMCIATIVDKLGPRLRLRLDGTDDRNDFWLLVDSEFIHPFEYTTKRGGTIQPPLGFRNNISTWPKFFDKLVQLAGDNTFARDTCFKTPPPKPLKNEFKKGQKLEAVDQKNPHLICPATVKDCDKDNIYISFDGWSQSCNFWCPYSSRDIFPVGWCKLAKHPLQYPGNFDEKRKSHRRSGGTISNTNTTTTSSTTTTTTASITNSQSSNNVNNNHNDSFSKQNKNSENINTSQTILNTSKSEDIIQTNDKSPLKQNNNNLNKPTNGIDLSIVKTESVDNFDFQLNKKDNSESSSKNENVNIPKKNNLPKCNVYVNPSIDCNKYLNSNKFHANYKQFGPDIPKNLFKLILQAFINCAHDSTKIFDLIQDGDSTSYIKFKTPHRNERKHLPKIENEAQLWANLQLMCKLFSINENLFIKTPPGNHTISENGNNINGFKQINNENKLSLANNSRSNSVDSNFKQTINNHINNVNENLNGNGDNLDDNNVNNGYHCENINTNKMKRRSSSDDSYTQAKILKFDLDNPNQWDVEQVGRYVSQTDPNLASHIDILKYQEIDGKALMLLTTDVMMKYMGLKLGPALKLSNLIERLKRKI